jgi:FkbM family methyltransferase
MRTYALLQIPRARSELRCAVAARRRPMDLDDGANAIARVLETLDVVIDPRDQAVAHPMKTVGFWEWWITRAMTDCMRPGTVCVDVGANAGYFAVLFVALGAGEVIAIEPHPGLAARLRQTAQRNHWAQLRVIESAVGDVPGRANLFVQGDDNLGGATLIEVANDRTIDVPVETLDTLLGELRGVQVLKLDCEGFEPRIWLGMQGLLARNPDMHVFAELLVNHEAAPWLQQLVAQGWQLRFVDYDAEIRPLRIDQIGDRTLWMLYLHRDES